MQYRAGGGRNLKEIARELGVAHILEGTVRSFGTHIRISAQLIDARTDGHLWADQYDKDLTDIFAIQSEIAEAVARQLEAKLSPQEKAAIEEPPTANLAAFELYVRGKSLLAATTFNARKEDLVNGTSLLAQATAVDPEFSLAYYQLARAHCHIYRLGIDHTAARLELAAAAVKAVARLRPDSGEAHLAAGELHYYGYRNYDQARQEFIRARRALPNDPRPDLLLAYIDRREGRSEKSLEGFKRSLELDPRSLNVLQQLSLSYQHLRRYREMADVLDRALVIAPDDVGIRIQRASVELEARAATEPLRAAINSITSARPDAATSIADTWLDLSLSERNPAEAQRAVAAMTPDGCSRENLHFPRAYCAGQAAKTQVTGGRSGILRHARAKAAQVVAEQPDYAEGASVLGLIDAALGRKAEAIAAGRHAVELLPVAKDSIEGALLVENLALIYAWTGETDLALADLEKAASLPGSVSYGNLKLHPNWDQLRGDPRFEAIVASLAPK